MKFKLSSVVLAGGVLAVAAAFAMPQDAEAQLKFALVPKTVDNPFFIESRDGCFKAAAESNGAFECLFEGPPITDGAQQLQVIQDLISRGVDGLAVSPADANIIAAGAEAARDAGIPFITWDADLVPEDFGLRQVFVGTKNRDIGVNLAKQIQGFKPEGGSICIQSGGVAAANHNERMDGIRDTLGGFDDASTEPPGQRLEGENGWTELAQCPLFTEDDFALAVQQMEDIFTAVPDLDVFVPTGGFQQFLPDANRAALTPFKDRLDSKETVFVIADVLPIQLEQLKEGWSHANVGQCPFCMGEIAMQVLLDIVNGNPPAEEFIFTPLPVCTQENVDTCTQDLG